MIDSQSMIETLKYVFLYFGISLFPIAFYLGRNVAVTFVLYLNPCMA